MKRIDSYKCFCTRVSLFLFLITSSLSEFAIFSPSRLLLLRVFCIRFHGLLLSKSYRFSTVRESTAPSPRIPTCYVPQGNSDYYSKMVFIIICSLFKSSQRLLLPIRLGAERWYFMYLFEYSWRKRTKYDDDYYRFGNFSWTRWLSSRVIPTRYEFVDGLESKSLDHSPNIEIIGSKIELINRKYSNRTTKIVCRFRSNVPVTGSVFSKQ